MIFGFPAGDRSMLPRVFAPCKRHSSKERANFRRCAAMLTDTPKNGLAAFDF
jgi:hypothetical protein